MGNGHPVAAVVTRPEIVASLTSQAEFFSTFGGNPISCAAGLFLGVELEVIEREGLQEHARGVGAHLAAGIEAIARDCALIGDVRGAGRDGVLIGLEGPLGNVLKIRPPLVFSASDGDRLLDVLERALRAI